VTRVRRAQGLMFEDREGLRCLHNQQLDDPKAFFDSVQSVSVRASASLESEGVPRT